MRKRHRPGPKFVARPPNFSPPTHLLPLLPIHCVRSTAQHPQHRRVPHCLLLTNVPYNTPPATILESRETGVPSITARVATGEPVDIQDVVWRRQPKTMPKAQFKLMCRTGETVLTNVPCNIPPARVLDSRETGVESTTERAAVGELVDVDRGTTASGRSEASVTGRDLVWRSAPEPVHWSVSQDMN